MTQAEDGSASLSKIGAQARTDRIRAFHEELEQLEREGVLALDADERARLAHYHQQTVAALSSSFDVDTSPEQKQLSWGMRITALLGALALCAAVFSFFYRFWGLLSTSIQVLLLVLAPMAAVAATEFAARRERTFYFAALAAIVAFASFILNLHVLGRIFALPPSSGAFLAWSAFALFLAYGYRLRLLLLGGLVCAVAFLAASLTGLTGAHWSEFWDRPETIIAAGIPVLLVGIRDLGREFAPIFRLVGAITILLSMMFLASTGHLSFLPLRPSAIEVGYQFLGLAAAAGAIWLGLRRWWPGVTNVGTVFFALFLFLRLYDWLWDWMPRYLFFLLLGLIAVGLLALLKRLRATAPEGAP